MRTWLSVGLLALACDVPEPPTGTGGIGEHGPCETTFVVVESDYLSTNVAVLSATGDVLSGSLASSATANLSGDVVTPSSPTGGAIVLLDRSQTEGAHVLWVDPHTAGTRADLPVTTGFPSNPRDYLDVSARKAYVTRFEENRAPGKEPFDAGSDVLVVDPVGPRITGSIDMRPAVADLPGVLPRPDRMARIGGRAFVLLDVLASDFASTAPSRLVTIDTETDHPTDVLLLDGLRGCAGLAPSPEEAELAVFCLGGKVASGGPSDLGGSGVGIVDVTGAAELVRRFPASDLGEDPVGFFGDWAAPSVLLLQTFGHDAAGSAPAADDRIVRLDVATGAAEDVLRSAGAPFVLGGVACEPACGACFVTDADRDVVHRFAVDPRGTAGERREITVERRIGLPPRYLGKLR